MIDIFALLSELVRRWDDKEHIMNLLEELLRGEGVEVKIGGGNYPFLLSRIGEGEPSLCLFCHIDTPPPYALSQPYYRVENDKAYGLGVCDKASVVAMLGAFLEIKGKAERGSLDILITSDSEEKGEGLKRVFEEGYLPRWAIIGEPTNLSIVTQHPGLLLLDIYCYGLSAPISFPLSGINSINEMMDFLSELKERLTFVLVGIKGGESFLRLPERCHSIVAIPIPLDRDASWALRILDSVLKKPRWIDVSYHILRVENPLKEEIFSPLARLARDVAREVLGLERELSQPGWSEASRFQERGAEVVVFGAGEPKVAHSGEEYVVLEDIVNQIKILKGVALSLLGSKNF
jgi:acetylornithine deacetylase/succinyl-diaminopimelate desuccinylase-like protein